MADKLHAKHEPFTEQELAEIHCGGTVRAVESSADLIENEFFWREFATRLAGCPMLCDQVVKAAAIRAGVDPRRAIAKVAAYCHPTGGGLH
jgi:hypothetical protein